MIIYSDTAEDVHDHSSDSEYVKNLETEDNSAEENEDNSAEETDDDSVKETDEEDTIEVDGKKGKLIARHLSVQRAKDFFDNL